MADAHSNKTHFPIIKTAQYLSGLTANQNAWEEIGKVLINFFDADLVFFGERANDGAIRHWHAALKTSLEKKSAELIRSLAPADGDLHPDVEALVLETLDSAFLSTRVINEPAPAAMAALPVDLGNRTTVAMVIAHNSSNPISKERLNAYLGVAGLAETTLTRLESERELRKHRRHLEALVAERTSELERTNKRLRDSEQKLAAILASSTDLMIMLDKKMTIVWSNDIAERIFGRDVLGEKCHDVFHQKKCVCDGCIAEMSFADGQIHEREIEVVHPDGEPLTMWCTTNVATRDEDGEPTLVVETVRDVTERKHREEQLLQAKDEAQSANRAKSEFLANMSHEIRTPMNGVIGMASLLLETNLNEEQTELAEIIARSGQSLLRIINDILDLSRLEAGKFDIEENPFKLDLIIDEVVKTLKTEIERKQLTFDVEINAPLHVKGDETRIRQVLLNLASNAVKFTDSGGVRITVETRPGDDDSTPFLFIVSDTGIGMDETTLKKVFEAFTQGDGSTTRRYGGSGLGLSIVNRLVALMNGRLEVKSEPNKGTEFVVTLPLKMGDSDSDVGCQRKPKHFDFNILVVDDVKSNRILLLRALQKFGCDVDCVNDGMAAIETLRKRRYDAVFLDVQMPVLDGAETTRRVRGPNSEVLDPNVPIIAVTAHVLKGDQEKYLASGMDDYLPKPFIKNDLERILDNLARRG